jgi:hypothetical protein
LKVSFVFIAQPSEAFDVFVEEVYLPAGRNLPYDFVLLRAVDVNMV